MFTAAAPALIDRLGLLPVLAITGSLLRFWFAIGYVLIQQGRHRPSASGV